MTPPIRDPFEQFSEQICEQYWYYEACSLQILRG